MGNIKVIDKNNSTKTEKKTKLKIVHRNNFIEKTLGYMFTKKSDKILIFNFNRNQIIGIHTFFVRFPLRCIWLKDNTIKEIKTLNPWKIYRPKIKSNRLIEIPEKEFNKIDLKIKKENKLFIK